MTEVKPIINLNDNIIVLQYPSYDLLLTEDKAKAEHICRDILHKEFNNVMWDTVVLKDLDIAIEVLHEIGKYYGRNINTFLTVNEDNVQLSGYLTM